MHNGENAFEGLLYIHVYKQCKHHTKDVFSVHKFIHFDTSYMYGKIDHLST